MNRFYLFRILVARPEHAGIYECKAESVAGDDKLSFNLDVHQPPTMITSNKEVSGIEGQNLVLECAAEGHPKPEIIWRKNGQKINLNSGGIFKCSRAPSDRCREVAFENPIKSLSKMIRLFSLRLNLMRTVELILVQAGFLSVHELPGLTGRRLSSLLSFWTIVKNLRPISF